ncbi:MAG TPA: TraR/DksA C4-type zinc finger protein [Candidatus Dormibacteraeota bacterium]|jgi:RNA polymerase-binding transcription factor DksA|nr:TraR/DksA C4-type zinc finger protein [Candidatus Dormibacteraeota bacterium]
MNVQALESRLRAERRDLEQTLQHINDLFSADQSTQSGELSSVDQHIADIATETEDRELDIARRKLVEDRIAVIDDALDRMQRGTYGRCVVCDAQIPEERLEALPWTPYCLTHAALEPAPASTPSPRAKR